MMNVWRVVLPSPKVSGCIKQCCKVYDKNDINGVLDHLCAHIGYTGPGESPEDGEMNDMTLSSSGKKLFVFFETCRPELGSNQRSPMFRAGSFNHCTWASPCKVYDKVTCTIICK